MSRINTCFKRLQTEHKTALIVYLVAGDPNRKLSLSLMHDMVKSGADIIELGIPFSDPEAEGPVIQAGCERALAGGIRLLDVLDIVAEFRKVDDVTPVLLMGYVNPIERMGNEQFAKLASGAGVDGTIIVNLPPEEGTALNAELARVGIDPVYLLAPTTTQERARKICEASRGFVYYVSLKGVTGAGSLDVADVSSKLAQFKGHTSLPIAVGFGIKDPVSAAAVARLADGVVVGSALVKLVGQYAAEPQLMASEVCSLIAEIRQAIDVK